MLGGGQDNSTIVHRWVEVRGVYRLLTEGRLTRRSTDPNHHARGMTNKPRLHLWFASVVRRRNVAMHATLYAPASFSKLADIPGLT